MTLCRCDSGRAETIFKECKVNAGCEKCYSLSIYARHFLLLQVSVEFTLQNLRLCYIFIDINHLLSFQGDVLQYSS